ncbi:LOW QUALITY PROTEIN: myelin-associated glycoprotein-like [Rhincodon typus]|uniref:LOW QUALITY PROTEIN: myelin-associated glycoprotein-like n=1 Tax=Rhincodon typus TaxID=259920 RepID=UPI00202E1EBD|nr:LOW QUALITY PROTEIN: myelin-associated glycoprotein-like [Rhincodon typus]
MIGKSYFLLLLLQGVATEEWTMTTAARKAINGSCVVIPCTFDFPSHPYKAVQGAWFKYWYHWKYAVVYSNDPNYGMSTFVGRTDIIGDLEQKDCSLKINNLRPEDSDNYYFYVDVEGFEVHTFKEPVHLKVLDVPDRPKMLLPRDLREGTSAYIICKALHTCPDNPPKLTWSDLPSSSVSDTTESEGEIFTVLTFNPSYIHHHQTVRCICDYPQTNHRVFNSVTLSVKYSPCNTSVRMTTGKGKTISLSCSGDGNPAVHRFSWFKISQGKVTDLTLSGQTRSVPYGFEVDISDYNVATNSPGSSQSLPVQIPIEYGPRNLSITSPHIIKDSSININEGNSAVIICSVESFPASNLMWRYLNVTMNKTSSNNELWLEIPHIAYSETGDYQCVAENAHGAVEGSITITLEYAPQNLSITSPHIIQDSSINIIEGNSAVIICSVESFPASNLTWRHLNVTMNRTSSNNELWLEIPLITSRETGDYQCVAENEYATEEGFISITVQYAPRNLLITSPVVIENSSINITEGNSAVIICSVNSFPASNLTWRHLNVTMNSTSSDNEVWLEIPHVTYRETGDYQCVAENEHGAENSFVTINVQYAPRETRVSTSGASGGIREGNDVTLTCSSESAPSISHYTWFRIEGNTSTQLNTSSRILSFTPVTRGDDAGFYCTATNPLGDSSSNTTHLNVGYGPELSQESECAWRADGITCVCVANSNPPGHLTWHLSHANLSGNQTHGGFESQQLRAGHLVMGSLFLMGHQDEEEVMASCSVRNPHGATMFKLHLWVKGRDSNKWKVGLVMAGIMLNVFLAGILIFLCVRKRKTATEETASKTNEIGLTYSQLSVKHQGSQNMVVTDLQNTTRDTTREGETSGPQDVFDGAVGRDTGHQDRPSPSQHQLY